MKTPEAVRAIDYVPSLGNFLTMVCCRFARIHAACAPVPRQRGREFQRRREVGRARWLFPLYLVAINLFVIRSRSRVS